MKLTAEIAGEQCQLQIRRDKGQVMAEVNGRHYEVEVREPEPGVYLLLAGGDVYECRVDQNASGRGASEVHTGGHTYSTTLTDPKRLRGAQGSGADAEGRAEIVAPMPGKVVRVLVEVGAQVEAGDGIVVVEAMKMQNELKSPKTGIVIELRAAPGSTVNGGDVLAVIE